MITAPVARSGVTPLELIDKALPSPHSPAYLLLLWRHAARPGTEDDYFR